MARDPLNRAFRPTTPEDLVDPPRFGQPTETAKDVLVLELRRFLANAEQTAARREELPTVEKYATFGDGNDPYSTAVAILRKLPDTPEALPHIAVMAASGSERRLNIGPPFVGTVQEPARITAANVEPYALADGDTLVLRMMLDATTSFEERVVFTASRFPTGDPIGAALAEDVARVFNEQALHSHAGVVEDGGDVYVVLEAGGPLSASQGRTPTVIEVDVSSSGADEALGLSRRGDVTDIVVPGSEGSGSMTLTGPAATWSADDVGLYCVVADSTRGYFNDGRFLILAQDGDEVTLSNRYAKAETGSPATWFIGARDANTNVARPPKHRYAMAFDLSIQIDVFTQDENTRGEIVDLVASFFSFFLESQFYTFHGRTGFSGQTVAGEYYQMVINPPLRSVGENEFARGADGTGKVHVNSFGVDVTISMYIDRDVYIPDTDTPFVVTPEMTAEDSTLPIVGQPVEEDELIVEGTDD